MEYFGKLFFVSLVALTVIACEEKHTAADSSEDMYVVSNGMLVVDTSTAGDVGIFILNRSGQKMVGVVPLRHGFSISRNDGGSTIIQASPDALTVLDSNKDNLIDANDPAWGSIHLAVDYNGDGNIGQGEYALIGECGVDALKIDIPARQVWSIHSDGKVKAVKLPKET